jgi:hypothetical protein
MHIGESVSPVCIRELRGRSDEKASVCLSRTYGLTPDFMRSMLCDRNLPQGATPRLDRPGAFTYVYQRRYIDDWRQPEDNIDQDRGAWLRTAPQVSKSLPRPPLGKQAARSRFIPDSLTCSDNGTEVGLAASGSALGPSTISTLPDVKSRI